MIKIKKDGFTLSEVLITLAVVGAVAALVLPGLIKDSANKANVALLQSTVLAINDAVQLELMNSGATNMKDTMMYNDPRGFFNKYLDVAVECERDYDTPCLGAAYKTYNGGPDGISRNVPTLLKSGAMIDFTNSNALHDTNSILIVIDTNGSRPPNIVGIDLTYVYIAGTTNLDRGVRMGDVRGMLQVGLPANLDPLTISNAELKNRCIAGAGSPCYLLLERTGFDPGYLEKNY